MGMAAWLYAGLRNRLAAAQLLGYRKTSRIRVGFLPEVWVSAFYRVGVRVLALEPDPRTT